MAKQQKSAKDAAFERERTKLNSTIIRLKNENATLRMDNERLNTINAELKSLARFYESEIERITGMSKEDFLKDVKRREKLDSAIELLSIAKYI